MKKIIIGAILVALSVLIPVSGANRTVALKEAQAQFKNRGQLRKAERHFEKGMRHYRQGHYRLAMLEFKLAVKFYPGHWQAHYYLADSYRFLGFYDLCLAHYDRVLVLYPRPIWVARVEYNIGTVHEKRGRHRLAGLHYDRALKARPGFGPAQKAKFRLVKSRRDGDWNRRDKDGDRDRERRNRY